MCDNRQIKLEFLYGYLACWNEFVNTDFHDFVDCANKVIADKFDFKITFEEMTTICENYLSECEARDDVLVMNNIDIAVRLNDDGVIEIVDVPDFEEEIMCDGKYCEETNGLKKGMGWNKFYTSVDDMVTEQLFCEDCFKENTGYKCKGCGDYYPYTELKYIEGGYFGDNCYKYKQLFCEICIKHINSIEYTGMD